MTNLNTPTAPPEGTPACYSSVRCHSCGLLRGALPYPLPALTPPPPLPGRDKAPAKDSASSPREPNTFYYLYMVQGQDSKARTLTSPRLGPAPTPPWATTHYWSSIGPPCSSPRGSRLFCGKTLLRPLARGPASCPLPAAAPPRLPEREPTALPLLRPVLCLVLLAAK